MWWGTALEAPDPAALARFYAKLLDWPIVHEEPGTTVVAPPPGSVYIVFQQADGYRPPSWPLAGGATLAPEQPQENMRVLPDPAGSGIPSACAATMARGA
jgi:glyoxalase superfamily protein